MQKQTNKKTNSDCYEFGIGVHTQRFPHLFSQYLQWRVLPYCCVFTRPSHKEGGSFNMLTVCLFDCFFFLSRCPKSALLRRWLVTSRQSWDADWFACADLFFVMQEKIQKIFLSFWNKVLFYRIFVLLLNATDRWFNLIRLITTYLDSLVQFIITQMCCLSAIFCDISKASENLTFILNKVLFCPVFVLLL